MSKTVLDENELIEKIKKSYSEQQSEMILRAFSVAKKANEGQLRQSGEPYFIHPCHVANILIDLGMDAESVAAGFLHDVLEDTPVTREELLEQFGPGATPPSETTATSQVPPPISIIIEPVASKTGSPAPRAAAIGASISSTS